MDSFIYDFFWINNNTRSWWLSPWQSFVSDFLIPIIASVVIWWITIHYAKKSYLLEKKLADLQIFWIIINISSQEFTDITWTKAQKFRRYYVNYVNKSHVEWYIVSAHLLLWGKYINAQSWRRIELLWKDMKLWSLEWKLLTLDLEWTKTVYKSDLKNNDLFIEFKDSLWNSYSEVFSREKFPELYE